MKNKVIQLANALGRQPQTRMRQPVNFSLEAGEHIAVMGPNGGGKSCLIDLITGKNLLREGYIRYDFGQNVPPTVYGNIVQLTFEDVLGSVEKPYYFQQRFNSQDRDESPIVSTLLKESIDDDSDFLSNPLLDTFKMRDLLDKRIVLLSSGEMRRYQLFKYLIKKPRVLILDNPFIGLDASMRDELDRFFRLLVKDGNVQLIMIISMLDNVPDYITHVVKVHDMIVEPKITRDEYMAEWKSGKAFPNTVAGEPLLIRSLPEKEDAEAYSLSLNKTQPDDSIISIHNLSLPLPDTNRVLYNGLDWNVHCGDKWALQGNNGSGKSTLLSLICADHPAAYACDISLFGRRRGTGESIWEIKKNIGFVSPEFHRAYKENRQAIEIVASGLHDSVGLYKRPHPEQMDICLFWMRVFGIEHLKDRLFLTLSSGEQRLCLLARAFVKDPALIILDEPLHGLDTYRRNLVRQVIAEFCHRKAKTLIMVTHYIEELPDNITKTLILK